MGKKRLEAALSELVEKLASAEHDRWAHWQRYVHSQCAPIGDDGALVIPGNLVRRWEEQIETPYLRLTEVEKESDREQVRRYLPLIIEVLSNNS
jgi:hypothetical protein